MVCDVTSEDALREAKRELRAEIRTRRAQIDHADRVRKSLAIQKAVVATDEYRHATSVLLYASTLVEVHTFGLIETVLADGKRVVLPRMTPDTTLDLHVVGARAELRRNRYGILEPREDAPRAAPSEIDLAIVPGVAFDKNCNRLGLGKAYYDRLLPQTAHAVIVGLAFEEQIVKEVPHEARDRQIDAVVTEKRIIRRMKD